MIITIPLLVLLGLTITLLIVFSRKEDKIESNWLSQNPNPIKNITFPKIENKQWIVYSENPEIELRIEEEMEKAESIASELGFDEFRAFVIESNHQVLIYYRYGRKQIIPNQEEPTTPDAVRPAS